MVDAVPGNGTPLPVTRDTRRLDYHLSVMGFIELLCDIGAQNRFIGFRQRREVDADDITRLPVAPLDHHRIEIVDYCGRKVQRVRIAITG